ncbi:MAG TPA: Rieske (2Fe-2S) protein [Bryobacteraceae bacterium]|jgi:nitrite reductase/ring-hydroxylating ferredoxin subunit/uncharacterized membrane protein|nr:Rieske (2Fe-2S) protein [Bryobacteraceae bacterium]
MAKETALNLLDRQQWLEPLADQLQLAVAALYDQAGAAGQKVKNALHGVWLGHPLHPVLTDIPVGAWTAALVMDALHEMTRRTAYARAADAAIAVGLAGAAGAALAGLTDWQATDGRARRIGLAHALLNGAGALLYAGSLASRKKQNRTAGRALSMIGYAVAFGAAYLGGKLVYSEQVGVNHTLGQQLPQSFQPVLPASELAEGCIQRVEVDGGRILLARRDGRIFAIAEICSHMGGPLAEGELGGCRITCPWHGSTFSLEDGRVINGPATHPQPCLETRVRDGQIEVRLRRRTEEGRVSSSI